MMMNNHLMLRILKKIRIQTQLNKGADINLQPKNQKEERIIENRTKLWESMKK